MLSCSVWFSAPSFWMDGGLESRCVDRVYGADGAVLGTIRTIHGDPPSGSQYHHPSKNSVQKTIRCNSTSNAPDDGRMYPKHVEHHPYRTHDPRSGSQEHHPSKNSVQKTICCNSTSNAPDDGRMYPKHVELRIHQYNYLVASSWRFTLFNVCVYHLLYACFAGACAHTEVELATLISFV